MKKYWRMAFRNGPGGSEVWPHCQEKGIAAISYSSNRESLGDLTGVSREEYDDKWRRLSWGNPSGQASFRKFRYEMKRGDIIYVKQGVKQGPNIVGKGVIKSGYKYDPKILEGCKVEVKGREEEVGWEHYREVDWVRGFQSFRCVLGADPHTVLELNEERLNKILKREEVTLTEIKKDKAQADSIRSAAKPILEKLKKVGKDEAKEGERYLTEVTFRVRNRGLIRAKKDNSDYCCEVCKMGFKDTYGVIGEKYIIAHHVNPIGNRKRASKTTLDDIALVCSNCHDMLHRSNPPYKLQELRHFISQ